MKLVTAYGRNDEGIHYWIADIDEDNDGYNTSDQGDGIVDAFPTDGTQWNDTDGDGYGDNPAPALQPDDVHLILAPLHKTVSDVLIAMVIVGQMQEIGLQTI